MKQHIKLKELTQLLHDNTWERVTSVMKLASSNNNATKNDDQHKWKTINGVNVLILDESISG